MRQDCSTNHKTKHKSNRKTIEKTGDLLCVTLLSCAKKDKEHWPQIIECTLFCVTCAKAFFTEDTALCLSTWTAKEDLTPKCAGVFAGMLDFVIYFHRHRLFWGQGILCMGSLLEMPDDS